MRRIVVIGIGAGDPEYLTVQAIKALNEVDAFFVTRKGDDTDDLVRLRTEICDRYVSAGSYRFVEIQDPARDRATASYRDAVEAWHEQRALLYEQLIRDELGDDECGGFLAWGDPMLYDSILRILRQISGRAPTLFEFDVVPGITSVQALAAKHRIPINEIGEPVLITTGRRLASDGLPEGGNTIVMLDGSCSFRSLVDDDVEIYWGAYLGTEDEILISGKLSEVADEIEGAHTRARHDKGWIMETYLLRRSD